MLQKHTPFSSSKLLCLFPNQERLVIARAREWLSYTVIISVMMFSEIQSLEGTKITIIEDAVAKGAVCLDGSPPAYQLDKGFGKGVNNWLVRMQGGAWCHTVDDCVDRKTYDNGLGSSKLMTEVNFSDGIMSNERKLNPSFYNWNKVIMRYCDGASFTGDVDEVDHGNKLYFRGAKIFDVIVEELMKTGMKDAKNVLLSGCSAGGLASILNCDKFREFFHSSTRVKCLSDGGYFSHVKDLTGEFSFDKYFDKVVTLHGSAKHLPSGCTSNMKPSLCFYPQFVMPYIKTPIFILNSAYDAWQVSNIFAPKECDPNGKFTKCKRKLDKCSTGQLKRFEDFRSEFLKTVSDDGGSSRGMFINTCYTHCQSKTYSSWLGTSKLGDKTIEEGVSDWFYDKKEFRKIDTEQVLPHYC